MNLNNFTAYSANKIAREIVKGPQFAILRQPVERNPQKWAKTLELLYQRVDQLAVQIKKGDSLDRELLEKTQLRLMKIAELIPKKWIFKSENQKKIEKAQSVVQGLLASDTKVKRSVGVQKITPKTSGSSVLKIMALAATFFVLFASGAGATSQSNVAVAQVTVTGSPGFSPSCVYTPEDTVALRNSVLTSSRENRLFPIEGASSGAYFAFDAEQHKLAVVKPEDERTDGPQNKVEARRKQDLSEEDQYQLNHYRGNSAKRLWI
jgi:hypothetical protein